MEVSGTIKNKKSGETIVGAAVFKSDSLGKPVGNGVISDIDGKYKIPSVQENEFITASILGMKPLTQKVTKTNLDFNLEDSATTTLGTFEVVADRPTPQPQPSINKMKLSKWVILGIGLIIVATSIFSIRKMLKK
jgi:hypothetical protein